MTEGAVRGLERCRRFLLENAPDAVERAAQAIERHFLLLETRPEIGRLVPGRSPMRELSIKFGTSGYVALYRFDRPQDRVFVLAFRHQKEAGY